MFDEHFVEILFEGVGRLSTESAIIGILLCVFWALSPCGDFSAATGIFQNFCVFLGRGRGGHLGVFRGKC